MQGLLVKGVPASITHIAKCIEVWAGKQWTVAYYSKNELYVKFTDQQKARNREEWEWVEVAVTSAKNVNLQKFFCRRPIWEYLALENVVRHWISLLNIALISITTIWYLVSFPFQRPLIWTVKTTNFTSIRHNDSYFFYWFLFMLLTNLLSETSFSLPEVGPSLASL